MPPSVIFFVALEVMNAAAFFLGRTYDPPVFSPGPHMLTTEDAISATIFDALKDIIELGINAAIDDGINDLDDAKDVAAETAAEANLDPSCARDIIGSAAMPTTKTRITSPQKRNANRRRLHACGDYFFEYQSGQA